jgi:hypothetical protein
MADNQEPTIVEQAHNRASGMLTRGEEILYIAVQHRPVLNLTPEYVVLTSKRFIIFRPKLLGGMAFEDFPWLTLWDATLKEGMLGSSLSFRLMNRLVTVDHLPKAQARALYRYCQEQEEHARTQRRAMELEERRASAGGVVVQTSPTPQSLPTAPPTQPTDDPVAVLGKLKQLLDAGLVTQSEYDAKKAEVLGRL